MNSVWFYGLKRQQKNMGWKAKWDPVNLFRRKLFNGLFYVLDIHIMNLNVIFSFTLSLNKKNNNATKWKVKMIKKNQSKMNGKHLIPFFVVVVTVGNYFIKAKTKTKKRCNLIAKKECNSLGIWQMKD